MAIIDSRGFVNDGSANLTVQGIVAAGVVQPTVNAVTMASASVSSAATNVFALSVPGVWQVATTGSATAFANGGGAPLVPTMGGFFTGTLPAASLYPGNVFVVLEKTLASGTVAGTGAANGGGWNMLLSGAAGAAVLVGAGAATLQLPFFVKASGTLGAAQSPFGILGPPGYLDLASSGNVLTMFGTGSSVILQSDGLRWCVIGGSGSVKLSAT